ncbi:MAG: MFS transporter [Saprospiraceae bacterium]|nr:MFS transporter [Saprospiraceae bacterium]
MKKLLGYSDFRKLLGINFFLTLSIMMQELLVSYEMYKLTKNPLTLGLIGLSIAIPYIGLSVFGGYLADNKNKKSIIILSMIVLFACGLSFYLLYSEFFQLSQDKVIKISYLLFGISGLARGFYQPAISAIRPFLIPRELYSRGSSLNSSSWQMGTILGSIVSGILYSQFGLDVSLIASTFVITIAIFLASAIKTSLPILISSNDSSGLWKSILEGIHFVLKNKILLYSISLDLVTVLFAGVVAILPVFAEDILNVGPTGLGYLRAAPAIGTTLGLFFMSLYSPMNKAWRNMIIAVAGFGIATLIFAISKDFYLSLIMLFFTGIFDSISIVIRGSLLQLIPPDHLRGRVQSVNNIFISSSNELGAFESGVAAKLMGTIPSVIAGAGLTLVIITIVYYKTKDLLNHRFQ